MRVSCREARLTVRTHGCKYNVFTETKGRRNAILEYQSVNGSGYEANNQGLNLILTSSQLNQFPSATSTVNEAHARNTQKKPFLQVNRATATNPGLGFDAVFRDPWGNPYIITLDSDNDGFVQPALYRLDAVSQASGDRGLMGLA